MDVFKRSDKFTKKRKIIDQIMTLKEIREELKHHGATRSGDKYYNKRGKKTTTVFKGHKEMKIKRDFSVKFVEFINYLKYKHVVKYPYQKVKRSDNYAN